MGEAKRRAAEGDSTNHDAGGWRRRGEEQREATGPFPFLTGIAGGLLLVLGLVLLGMWAFSGFEPGQAGRVFAMLITLGGGWMLRSLPALRRRRRRN